MERCSRRQLPRASNQYTSARANQVYPVYEPPKRPARYSPEVSRRSKSALPVQLRRILRQASRRGHQ